MPEVIALIVAGSLLLGCVAVACLQHVLVRQGQHGLRWRHRVVAFLVIAAFLSAFGFLGIAVLDHTTFPWEAGTSIILGSIGLALMATFAASPSQRVGIIAEATAFFTIGIGLYTAWTNIAFVAQMLFFFALIPMILAGTLSQLAHLPLQSRQTGIWSMPPINLSAPLPRASRMVLAMACVIVLIDDGIRVVAPSASLVMIGFGVATILCASASFVCMVASYLRPWPPQAQDASSGTMA